MSLEKLASVFCASSLLFSGCSASYRFDEDAFIREVSKNRQEHPEGAVVFTFGGYGGNILGQIANQLRCYTDLANYHNINLWEWPEKVEIIKREIANNKKLILMAHSWGCADALEVADYLNKSGVEVNMVFFDAVHYNNLLLDWGRPKRIPSNVRVLLHYHAKKGCLRAGEIPDNYLENAKTEIVNIPVNTHHSGFNSGNYYENYISDFVLWLNLKRANEKRFKTGDGTD